MAKAKANDTAKAVVNPTEVAPEKAPAKAKAKKKHLVIVESPAKAKTINKYLGADFDVMASIGHVRDLPKSRFGIDIDGGWIPLYRTLKDRKEVIEELKKVAAKADIVYLAPDPDREGEAIAWHLKEALGLKDEQVRRVTFNEITKTAVHKAFQSAGVIDMDRVAAQEARRFLDRVVGYKLSPLLSRRWAEELSAGRVQSVAVRLIVDREREIGAFVAEEFWRIAAVVKPAAAGGRAVKLAAPKARKGKPKPADETLGEDGAPVEAPAEETLPEGAFLVELAEWDAQKFKASNQADTDAIVKSLEKADYVVSKIEQKDKSEKAPPPFTTSTLQQQGSLRLRFPAKRTMQVAQQLYQGVPLGKEGSVALITYMRTDSTRISDDALAMARDHVTRTYGPAYLPEQPNRYAASKDAQGAHEAIRPTDLSYTPEKVEPYLASEQMKLYKMIYERFVAGQMKPAIFAVTNVEVSASKGVFKAQGKIQKFDGWRKVWSMSGKQEDTLLPDMKEREAMDLLQLRPTQHFTEPPARYNEASLVKTLEKEGIGRPSTYATIISKIQERNYVEQRERRFFATETGKKVTDLLVEHFPKVMDLKFTRHMEEELDQIESRELPRNQVLQDFYEPFAQSLSEAEGKLESLSEPCPLCGSPLSERRSRIGKFFGCSRYPDCKYIKKTGVSAEAMQAAADAPKIDVKCPTCGKDMAQRIGKRGPFLACSGYPDCKTTMNLGADGTPTVTAKPTEYKCEKCGSLMVLREGPRGPFLGCSNYPKCRGTKQMTDEQKEKFKDALPPAAPKKAEPEVEIKETCPECTGPMKLRRGFRGSYFLGCVSYPKCKGTRKMTPEIQEQIDAAVAAPPAAPAPA